MFIHQHAPVPSFEENTESIYMKPSCQSNYLNPELETNLMCFSLNYTLLHCIWKKLVIVEYRVWYRLLMCQKVVRCYCSMCINSQKCTPEAKVAKKLNSPPFFLIGCYLYPLWGLERARPSTDMGPPFLYGDSDTPPHLVAFYDHAGDTEDTFST